MNLANPMGSRKKVTASAYYKQQQKLKAQHAKILSSLKEQKIDEKLIGIIARFLKLEDERNVKGFCVHMSEYLETVTFELNQFITEPHKESILKLFRLFMRINFNKEAIYKYYRDHLDQLLAKKEADTKTILDQFSHKCSSPVRGDVSYNWRGNQLRADMLSEVEIRRLRFRQDNEDFKPIRFDVTTGLMGAIIHASVEASLIEKPSNWVPFFETLSRVLRRADGTPYEKSTFKNTITSVKEMHAKEAKEMLIKMGQVLDQRIEDLKK